jgi:hypothetical protein
VIKIDSLDEGAGTITNPDNGNSYFSHTLTNLGRFDQSPSQLFAAAPAAIKHRMCPRSRSLARTDIRIKANGTLLRKKTLVRI